MRRLLASAVLALPLVALLVGGPLGLGACGDSSLASAPERPDGAPRRDGEPVEPPDAAPSDAGGPPSPVPSCTKYCELVLQSCAGDLAQYASDAECLAFCARLPEGRSGEDDTSTRACRAYYAGGPARSAPGKYCAAAGPYGGGVCGDRCTAFCRLSVSACDPDAGTATAPPPYPSYPDCATACAGYTFRDAGADGGGEGPTGPSSGDTLNCRLYELRQAMMATSGCAALGPDSGTCR